MQAVQFRQVTEDDYQDICKLITDEKELFFVYPHGSYPFTVEQIRQLSVVRKELTVATDSSKVVGFANLYDYQADKSAFIGNVVIDKSCRRKGIGKSLLAYMLALSFEKHNLPQVRISVFSHNIPALLLYSSFGFTPYQIEERKDFTDKRVALVHMKMNKIDYDKT